MAALQLAVLVPMVLLYVRERRDLPLHDVYTPIMIAVWLAFFVALVWYLRQLWQQRQPA